MFWYCLLNVDEMVGFGMCPTWFDNDVLHKTRPTYFVWIQPGLKLIEVCKKEEYGYLIWFDYYM